jgi:PilZ domain
MENEMENNDQRAQPRVSIELPATISVGTQLTVKGLLKDISLNSAFIKIKSNLYLNINDEIGFIIQCSTENANEVIQGLARISRMDPGAGYAVYFTKIDEDSLKKIKKLFQKSGIESNF